MSGYKENIPSDDEGQANGEVQYVDDNIIDAMDAQEEEDFNDDDSGFQTFDEGSVAGDESFNDGEIEKTVSDAIAQFDDHADSVYCVAVLEQPVVGGSILFVSGDGRDKAYVWTVTENKEEAKGDNQATLKLKCEKIHELAGHTETVELCKFDSSGKYLVTGGMNN